MGFIVTSGISFGVGRWPEKSIKFITRLLKNAESNADAKNIDVEELYIKNIVVQQAPVRKSWCIEGCITEIMLLENPPPHIPCTRSHQPVPGPPCTR